MEDYNSLFLTCASALELVKAKNMLSPHMPLEIRHTLNHIFIHYLHYYGPDGAFDRMNNRTIGKIISEFAASGDTEPIASGERDGTRFQLFESPESGEASESPGAPKPRTTWAKQKI